MEHDHGVAEHLRGYAQIFQVRIGDHVPDGIGQGAYAKLKTGAVMDVLHNKLGDFNFCGRRRR